jgi:hypothetical protein
MANGYSAPEWQVPEGVEEVEVDSLSGYQAHDGFPTRKEYVIKGTLPPPPDPVHTKLIVCRGQNKLATDAQRAAGEWEEKEFIVLKEEDPVSQDGKNRWQEAIDGWIAGQTDTRYQYPKEMCGDNSDISARIKEPGNEKSYPNEDITVEFEANSGDGIEKMELWVNGSLKETINNYYHKGTINLPAGQYEIYVKARSRSGKEATSGTVKIGTGGRDWKKSEPSPSPTPAPVAPSPSPSPSAAASPSPSPSASPAAVL